MKETGSVLDVKDGWIQETIELLVEVRVLPEGETREDREVSWLKGQDPRQLRLHPPSSPCTSSAPTSPR